MLSAEGEHEVARELHDESLAIREAANDARGIGLSLLAIAVASAQAEAPERGWARAQRALALFDRTDDGPGRASAVMQLGYLAADAGRLRETALMTAAVLASQHRLQIALVIAPSSPTRRKRRRRSPRSRKRHDDIQPPGAICVTSSGRVLADPSAGPCGG